MTQRQTQRGVLSILGRAPVTLLIAAVTCLLFCMPSLASLFECFLHQPSRWQMQRLFGCHLLHWSGEHLLWDLGMFIGLGMLCERRMPRAYYGTLALGGWTIPLVIMGFNPHVTSYRGLSGLDTGIFCLLSVACVCDGVRERYMPQVWLFSALLAALVCKVAFEFCTDATLFVTQADFTPLPIAHLVGGLCGAACAALHAGCQPRRGAKTDASKASAAIPWTPAASQTTTAFAPQRLGY
jgi:rhomboid family GlyGly-CTERM serine protease